jgi:molybdenum cofactor guanylyltransferase
LALNTIFDKLKNQKVFIITVDTPFVSIESINKLFKESKDVDICVAQTERIHNLCGIFSSDISLSIKNMINNDIHKIGYLIKNNKSKIVEFPDNDEFININNKDEYKRSHSYISKYNN